MRASTPFVARVLLLGISLLADAGHLAAATADLQAARDQQNVATLEKLADARTQTANSKPKEAGVQYEAALAWSYLSEVKLELRDKPGARTAAERGIPLAQRAVAADTNKAEFHRLLGTLCGQIIPADPMAALKHGKCAKQEIEVALKQDPNSAMNWLSSGVGKFYLPKMFGGGVDLAMQDFKKAASLDPKLAEAWLWIGLGHRKLNQNKEAQQALAKAKSLAPKRLWIQTQLEKTPAK